MRLFLCPTMIRRLRQLAILVGGSLCIMALLHLARRPLLGHIMIYLAKNPPACVQSRPTSICNPSGPCPLTKSWEELTIAAGVPDGAPTDCQLVELLDDHDKRIRDMAFLALIGRVELGKLSPEVLPTIKAHWASTEPMVREGCLYLSAGCGDKQALLEMRKSLQKADTIESRFLYCNLLMPGRFREVGDGLVAIIRNGNNNEALLALRCLLSFMRTGYAWTESETKMLDGWVNYCQLSTMMDDELVRDILAFWQTRRHLFRTVDTFPQDGPFQICLKVEWGSKAFIAMLHHALLAAGALAWVAFMLLWWTVKGWRARRREARLHPLPKVS